MFGGELRHYGRKGMKWGKNIFEGEQDTSAGRTNMRVQADRFRGIGNAARSGGGTGAVGRSSGGSGSSNYTRTSSSGGRTPYVSREFQEESEYNSRKNSYPSAMTGSSTSGSRGSATQTKPLSGSSAGRSSSVSPRTIDDEYQRELESNSQKNSYPDAMAGKPAVAPKKSLFDHISDAARSVGDWASGAAKDVGNAAKDAGDWVSGAAKDVGDWGKDVLGKGASFISGLFGGKKSEPSNTSNRNSSKGSSSSESNSHASSSDNARNGSKSKTHGAVDRYDPDRMSNTAELRRSSDKRLSEPGAARAYYKSALESSKSKERSSNRKKDFDYIPDRRYSVLASFNERNKNRK